uniref:Uncharacterized protein n=1 Tax=Anguilla anguilla TaxID=7936 RepID=A0A0E9XSR7_ANGAN
MLKLFRYLQVCDFTTRKTTCNINAKISAVEQLLLLGLTKKSITRFYNVLSQTEVLNMQICKSPPTKDFK